MASTGHALIRKHFRKRFGVSAQQVAIRPETPWYWRAIVWVIVLGSSLAFSVWMYDAGRQFAGFDQGTLAAELRSVRQQSVADAEELTALRTAVGTAESQLQVERATLERLSAQMNALQRENATLKEELAFFEGLASGGKTTRSGAAITRATISVDANGRARYRVLLSNPSAGRRGEPVNGELQFELKLSGAGGDATMLVPEQTGGPDPQFQVMVKHFVRLEGEFPLQSGANLVSGEVRFVRGAQVLARQAMILEP